MKSFHEEMLRSKSIDSKSHNSSVYSILKDPHKSKLKHNRSVRFIEPDFSSEESVEYQPKMQQAKVIKPPLHSYFTSPAKKISYESPQKPSTQNLPQPKPQERKAIKQSIKTNNKPSTKKPAKGVHSSTSPKFEPKVMNFEFRDQSFYQKLNKFICNKSPRDPERGKINDEEAGKISMYHSINKSCEFVMPDSEKGRGVLKGYLTGKKSGQGNPRYLRQQNSYLLN